MSSYYTFLILSCIYFKCTRL